MRVVTSPSCAVIGPGRAGRSFAAALLSVGYQIRVLGRDDDYGNVASDTDIVLVCVPDAAVAEVARSLSPGLAVVAHTSGSLGLDALSPHTRVGAIHPLASLPDATIGQARLLSRCTFAIDGHELMGRLVDALGGIAVRVADEQRPLYHATATVAANHLVTLCGQVERMSALAGVPADAYWRLMSTTLENVRGVGASSALTGPAARSDWETIRRHLDAIKNPADRLLYLELARHTADLAGNNWPEELT